jgi:peptidyl-prolyl cis-trans isomerase C
MLHFSSSCRLAFPVLLTAALTALHFNIAGYAAPLSLPADADTKPAAIPAAAGEKAKPGAGVVVATVNDEPFYKEHVDLGVAQALAGQKADSTVLPTIQATVLKNLIGNFLLSKFLLSQKDLVKEADIRAAMNDIRNQLRSQNTTLEAYLASQKMTEQALMSQVAWKLLVAKYVAANTTPEGLQKFFDEHHENFDGTVRRVSHVLLRPDGPADEALVKSLVAQAEAIRKQLQSGQLKFEDAAVKYSAGPSRQHGGDLGYVPQTGVMAPAFTKAAYALTVGEISEPVVSPSGVHLIKVTEVKAGTKKLEDVKQQVEQAYSQYLIEKLIEEQEKAAKIEYAGNYPHFKPGTREVVMPGSN